MVRNIPWKRPLTLKNYRMTIEEIREMVATIHPDAGFIIPDQPYQRFRGAKITLICPKHGEFRKTVANLEVSTCKWCGYEARSARVTGKPHPKKRLPLHRRSTPS